MKSAQKRVLIIDDEEGIRVTLAANLELEGYEVVLAECGRDAIALVDEEPFTLVVTDIQMPGLSGLDTYRAIRKRRPDQPVLMMTGFAAEPVVDAALDEGVFGVLVKPFDVDQLVRIVEIASRAPTVLILDASADRARETASPLRGAGIAVKSTGDAAAALQLIRGGSVDTCILAGLDDTVAAPLVGWLRGSARNLNVIVLVAGSALSPRLRSLASAARSACLRQPVAPHDLVAAVARLRSAA